MAVQDIPLFSLASGGPSHPITFSDPEWRGEGDEGTRLRPLIDIEVQIRRLEAWITAGNDYGWLGSYQTRRAAFELQSIRAQIAHETASNNGQLEDDHRRAIQSRLDRLQGCLEAARASVGLG